MLRIRRGGIQYSALAKARKGVYSTMAYIAKARRGVVQNSALAKARKGVVQYSALA